VERVNVILAELPCTVRGYTVMCEGDGEPFYTIVINSRMGSEVQRNTYDHEIKHIDNHDFDKMVRVDSLETLRHAV